MSDCKPDQEIVTVRPTEAVATLQRLPYFVGVSAKTSGSKAISMNMVVIPAGGAAEPHYHRGYETAIYVLKGRIETRYGAGLKRSIVNEEGDFVFIPPGLPHQPVNLSATEPRSRSWRATIRVKRKPSSSTIRRSIDLRRRRSRFNSSGRNRDIWRELRSQVRAR